MLHIHKTPKANLRHYGPQQTIKLCKTCRHYQNGLCRQFVSIDLLEGHSIPVNAFDARRSNDLCGKDGIYHEVINTSKPTYQELSYESQNP